MINTIALTQSHTLVHWSVNGKPVIFPLRDHENGETRGGIPLCIPMFSVQQRDVAGCQLPLHGLLMHSDHGEVEHDAETDTLTATSDFPATEKFNWHHTVETQVTETADSLTHHIKVLRMSDCSNPEQMPISLGFHPYFATHGDDFSFTIGDQTWNKDTLPGNIIDSAFTKYNADEAAVLRTAAHTVKMTSTGFDEYCLWTDDVNNYICIEPIWQYREFGLPKTGLSAGEEKVVTITLQATPR